MGIKKEIGKQIDNLRELLRRKRTIPRLAHTVALRGEEADDISAVLAERNGVLRLVAIAALHA